MKNKLLKEAIRDFLIWVVGAQVVLYIVMYLESLQSTGVTYNVHFERILMLSAIVGAIAVYHYFLLYLKLFQKGKYFQYIAGIVAVLAAGVLIDGIVISLTMPSNNGLRIGFGDTIASGILRHVFLYTPAALFYTLIKANVKLRKQRRELQQHKLQSSVAVLKQQLDPHFLFNTLNTIYATAQNENAAKTASAIEELSDLFRYSLQDAGQLTVPVERELAFIDKYLHLQELRLPDKHNITIDISVNWDKQPASVAPMLLLPFIENAFKYGISYDNDSEIKVHISVINALLSMDVINTDYSTILVKDSTGIGVQNTLRRLNLQYDGKYHLRQKVESGKYFVSLSIHL